MYSHWRYLSETLFQKMVLISILIIKSERILSTYIVIFIPKIIIILNSWTKANYSMKWLYHWTNISTTYNTYICTIYHPVLPSTYYQNMYIKNTKKNYVQYANCKITYILYFHEHDSYLFQFVHRSYYFNFVRFHR